MTGSQKSFTKAQVFCLRLSLGATPMSQICTARYLRGLKVLFSSEILGNRCFDLLITHPGLILESELTCHQILTLDQSGLPPLLSEFS